MRISDNGTVRTVRYATEDGDFAFVAWELFEGGEE